MGEAKGKMGKSRRFDVRQLGPLESRIMGLLWARGEGTVRWVAERVSSDRQPAYTTVMTVMTRLVEKRLLTRRLVGKAYTYRPAKTKAEFVADVSRSRVRELVRDFGDVALAHFVNEIEAADPKRLERLAAYLGQRRRGADERP